jgi:hypothetical protein
VVVGENQAQAPPVPTMSLANHAQSGGWGIPVWTTTDHGQADPLPVTAILLVGILQEDIGPVKVLGGNPCLTASRQEHPALLGIETGTQLEYKLDASPFRSPFQPPEPEARRACSSSFRIRSAFSGYGLRVKA